MSRLSGNRCSSSDQLDQLAVSLIAATHRYDCVVEKVAGAAKVDELCISIGILGLYGKMTGHFRFLPWQEYPSVVTPSLAMRAKISARSETNTGLAIWSRHKNHE
jgi:hypothetical protein